MGQPCRPLRILISAGPTREPIDAVRYLSNYSTGYMGAQLATEALRRGHRVTVVSGPGSERFPRGARVVPVETAHQMDRALRCQAPRADAVIMAAAVADFRPTRISRRKLSRQGQLTLTLEATPDLIARLPRRRGQVVVGFALETTAVAARARGKLQAKRLDLVFAQQIGSARAPFGRRPVDAWLVMRNGPTTRLGRLSKGTAAGLLLDKVEGLWYGQPR